MTMQRRPNNPIEKRKQAVRTHARNGAIAVVGGIGGGILLGWALTGFWTWMAIGLVVAVVGGVYNWVKIQKIVNENHNL
ncbi:hypothetical protein [Corynebacterium minutissimum]|mgnify:FL=1|uniref:Putative secreted protein n=1 Tax=Corynebacterium minutissimum TaxID=38301 RepID=A0A2X4RBW2_9CORY|nr:hypothetical protein [Corynebacterium minutissimum]KHO29108.1 hypothetical protein NX84_09160 [Corynebacterium minutissimum]MCG7230220.1 hypothetical protein [Corynebacterium minutissimum]MCG7239299.1 hypothetical protein [Corynebacterium minutissimum]QPS59257.1 hypothetical protein I6G51_10205 [Corynebacterium minutissimum]QQA79954.1 hypothetical protein I6H49_02655 [Corynebacterium minutissimum]